MQPKDLQIKNNSHIKMTAGSFTKDPSCGHKAFLELFLDTCKEVYPIIIENQF